MPAPVPTPNFDLINRDIGALQATVAMLADAMKQQSALHERQMKEQQEQYNRMITDLKSDIAEVRSLKDEIAAMKSLIDQAKGGWRILVAVGTVCAALGAVIAKIASFVWNIPIK